jgi:hypothetical protein
MVGIDREQWAILAVDIEVVHGQVGVKVHAFNRVAHGVEHALTSRLISVAVPSGRAMGSVG